MYAHKNKTRLHIQVPVEGDLYKLHEKSPNKNIFSELKWTIHMLWRVKNWISAQKGMS